VGFYENQDNFCISIPDKQTSDVIHLIKKSSVKTVEDALTIVKNLQSDEELES
jgi:hypothetical protein